MQKFNEDIEIVGELTVNSVRGAFIEKLEQDIRDINSLIVVLNENIADLKASNELLAQNYNNAVEVINNISERIAALESNYDPTVSK